MESKLDYFLYISILNKRIVKGVCYIFLFFVFFPYLKILPLSTDSQPNALLVGGILLPFILKKIIPKDFFYLFIVVVWAFIIVLFSEVDFNSVRSLLNYVSLFIISLVSYYCLATEKFSFLFFKIIVYVWFIIGFIQTFFIPSFLNFLLSRGDSLTTLESGRGVIAMAPEPTFYGFIGSCLMIIGYLNFKEKKRLNYLNIILLIQIVIFSRSSTTLLLLVISLGTYLFFKFLVNRSQRYSRLLKLILIIGIFYCIAYYTVEIFSSYRVGKIVSVLLNNPSFFVIMDESINERFIHAFFPIYAFITDWGVPHGYNYFAEYMHQIYTSGSFAQYIPYYKTDYTRIMSGLGSALFELGWFALLIIYVLFKNIKNIITNDFHFCFYALLFVYILFNAMPMSNAIIGFIFGNLIYSSSLVQEKQKVTN